MHFKDEILDHLAQEHNVAQFISFSPKLEQRHSRIYGYKANTQFKSLEHALSAILKESLEKSVNVRSFDPANPKSREFVYGLKQVDSVKATVKRLADQGLHTIVNETIDVSDGGVSGVLLGNIIEFAPDDTPRCVEKPNTASLPRSLGLRLLEIVYGFQPAFSSASFNTRVEFSIHPLRRGYYHKHEIIWEVEDVGDSYTQTQIYWPNRFSQFIGDKAFGLLVAYLLNLPVPQTTVFSRRVAPFSFGQPTGSDETWIRTCPTVQMPGKFTTKRGWIDPFKLMADEDPEGTQISSILAQKGVEATYSGALIASQQEITIEGTLGFGDKFMTGKQDLISLPSELESKVRDLYELAYRQLGPVRMEWVADHNRVWIVQFHCGEVQGSGHTIFPGNASTYHRFEVKNGLEELRKLILNVKQKNEGIVLVGNVGITSHFGDVLRRAEIPSTREFISQ